jgi:hypothetical protein
MSKNLLKAAGIIVVASIVLVGCQQEVASGDPVEVTVKDITLLHANARKHSIGEAIKQHKNITDDMIKANLIPKGLVKHGKAENAWSGRILIQVFPANAWGAGVPPTLNYVLESIPKKECSQLIEKLSRLSEVKIFQIHVEPSKKSHKAFPVAGDDGCSEGVNNIGYTVFAD